MRIYAVLVSAALLAACSPGGGATTHTLNGDILVKGTYNNGLPTPGCSGEGGFDDITSGTQVIVKNASDTIVGSGALEKGQLAGPDSTGQYHSPCRFHFAVANLPDSSFYQLSVGHRGAPTYSRADLDSQGWHIELSLGS